MRETRLTSKGQIVLPKELRERLRWLPGQRLAVEPGEDDVVILRPISNDIDIVLDELTGCLTGDPLGDLEAEHRAELLEDDRRTQHSL